MDKEVAKVIRGNNLDESILDYPTRNFQNRLELFPLLLNTLDIQ